MAPLSLTLIVLTLFSVVSAQIFPGSYELNPPALSENGSSATGHCSNVSDSGSICYNTPQRTSVLFDGIPTLPGLDGDMWASQLLTLNTSMSPASIIFDFNGATDAAGVAGYTGVESIEVVMLNCPSRGIGANTVSFLVGVSIGDINTIPETCEDLVRVCNDAISTTSPMITLQFSSNVQRVYLAEISFYSNPSRSCPPDGIIDGSISTLTTAPVTGSSSGATESVSSGSDNPYSQSSSMTMTREVTTMIITAPASPESSPSNAAAVVVPIVIIILLVVIAIVVVVVILLLLRWKKSYQKVYEIRLNSMYSNNTSAINPVVVDDDIELDSKSPTMTNSTEVKNESKHSVGGHQKCEEISDVDKNVPTPNSAVEVPSENVAGQVALVISPEYEVVDMPTKTTSEKPTNNDAGQVALVNNQVISAEYEDVDVPTKTTSEKPKNNDAGQVALVNNQVISPEYEDVDMPIKATTSEKSSKKVNVPQYEDMDDLIFPRNDKSSKDMSPTDNSKPYNRLSFDFGNTTSRRQTYDPSDNTYSHLDSTTIEEIRPRSDTVPAMYAAVHKPPKKPERRNTFGKIGEESDLPTVPEIPGKKSSDETLPADKLPPPKPSRRNTKSNNKEVESSLPPPIPEKTPALKNELKGMDSPSQKGDGMEQQDSATSSDITSENVASRSTKISVANNPLYGKEASRPSFENIYETVFQDFKQPEAFTEKKPLEVETSAQEEPLEVSKKNIKEEKQLGAGQFGRVILAKTVKLSHADLKMGSSTDTKISVDVAVKILKASASETTRKKFEKEYRFMFKLNHPNVIRMLGICTEGQQPFIMMEYMEKGDLLEILKTYSTIVKGEAEPGDKEITEKKLIDICTQIASGMVYLASKNLVHRDLAARNCLVGENFTVKVADFGMSRSLYDSNYYAMKGSALLPVRWMAYECFHGKFSTKTDVWAFGCTMWEVFDLAKQMLYPGMTDQEVVDNILLGSYCNVPYCPDDCPGSVYEIMRECWIFEPTDRATFEEVHSKLSALNMS